MSIIVEGPDNAGKSTLVRQLRDRMPWLILVPGEGPEKYPGEILERIKRYDELTYVGNLFDRHPCVSSPIYSNFNGNSPIPDETIKRFYSRGHLFIYCRGRGLEGNTWEDHDTDKQREVVQNWHEDICIMYDRWAMDHAHFIYRIGDPVERVMALVGDTRGVTG